MNIFKKSKMPIIITIDGPSGVGKGTLTGLLADYLGYHMLDSGLIYRQLGLYCIQNNIDTNDEKSNLDHFEFIPFSLVLTETEKRILQSSECALAASASARFKEVREKLLQLQRDYVKLPGLVTDGRDMGTIVFPDAHCKFFLDASVAARTQRRYDQLHLQNQSVDYDTLYAQIEARDFQDRNRQVAPLKPAKDAILIDSTELSIQHVFEKTIQYLHQKL